MTKYESFLSAKDECTQRSQMYQDQGDTEMADFYKECAKGYERKMLRFSIGEATTMVGLD